MCSTLHVGKFGRHDEIHGRAPQARGFQHIGLVHRGQLFAAAARQICGEPHNAFDLGGAVAAHIDRFRGGAGFLAEINAAGEFAHHHDVHAAQQLRLDRRGMEHGRVGHHGPQIGEQSQRLAQLQQALFRTNLGIRVRPFRAAHRPEQYGVRLHRQVQRGGRQGLACRVDGGASQER